MMSIVRQVRCSSGVRGVARCFGAWTGRGGFGVWGLSGIGGRE